MKHSIARYAPQNSHKRTSHNGGLVTVGAIVSGFAASVAFFGFLPLFVAVIALGLGILALTKIGGTALLLNTHAWKALPEHQRMVLEDFSELPATARGGLHFTHESVATISQADSKRIRDKISHLKGLDAERNKRRAAPEAAVLIEALDAVIDPLKAEVKELGADPEEVATAAIRSKPRKYKHDYSGANWCRKCGVHRDNVLYGHATNECRYN